MPLGWILLWRGDIVHGGGLQNEAQNGALRVHWYIPMKEEDKLTIQSNYFDNGDISGKVDRNYGEGKMSAFLAFYEPSHYNNSE